MMMMMIIIIILNKNKASKPTLNNIRRLYPLWSPGQPFPQHSIGAERAGAAGGAWHLVHQLLPGRDPRHAAL